MHRALLCSILAALWGCATPPTPSAPGPRSQLIEPTEHLPAPHHAEVPQDIKHLGAMVPRWTVPHEGRAGLSDAHVFQLSAAQGELRALSTKNGGVQWRTSVQPLDGSRPVWHAGHVLVATRSGLVAYAESSGQRAWTWPGEVKDLLVTDEALFVLGRPQGSNGQLQQLDVRTGTAKWAQPCGATCELMHAQGQAVLLSAVPGRMLRVEAGRIERILKGCKDVRSGALMGPDVLVVTSTSVTLSAANAQRWSLSLPQVRAAQAVGPHLLVDRGDALLGLDPPSGEVLWTTTLSPDLQGKLRLTQARHLPEGQLLVPTEDLFGAAPVYLLIRDDGTLRVLRYGLPMLQDILTTQENVLYAAQSQLVYSGTRRRGAPLRHYQTLEQDVAEQLATLARPAANPAEQDAHARALTWLARLGEQAYQQPLHAKIAAAKPSELDGLLHALNPRRPADLKVLVQAAWRLSVGPASLPAAQARLRALQTLPEPWPPMFWSHVLEVAPRWLAQQPRAGTPLYQPSHQTQSGLPQHPGARAQAFAIRNLSALQAVADRALERGDAGALWRGLQPVLQVQRQKQPCPWPLGLLSGPHPAPSRCPLSAPPPGALLSADADVAIWTAGAAGHPQDVWTMRREDRGWGPARFSGTQSAGLSAATFEAMPSASSIARDRDGDGLSDLLEARWGTDPRRKDSDRDGLSDDLDPSPSCPTPSADLAAQQLRTLLAQTLVGLQPRAAVWTDGSSECLSATVLSGPLLRPKAQPALPGQSVLSVDVLGPEAAAKAVRTAQASGQWRGPAPPRSIALRYGIVHGPLDGEGATVIFVPEGTQWRIVAWVDRWQS